MKEKSYTLPNKSLTLKYVYGVCNNNNNKKKIKNKKKKNTKNTLFLN